MTDLEQNANPCTDVFASLYRGRYYPPMDTRAGRKRNEDRWQLIYGNKVYNHLRSIQGSCLPVSPGILDFGVPFIITKLASMPDALSWVADFFGVPNPDK